MCTADGLQRYGNKARPELVMDNDDVMKQVVDAAIKVHRALGPGLLESAYEVCLDHELRQRQLVIGRQVPIPINYDGAKLDVGYRLDMLVNGNVVVEIKAVNRLLPIHFAQILTYLKLSNIRWGMLLNFNSVRMREGIRRVVNGF
jgi:GxxExxY protein